MLIKFFRNGKGAGAGPVGYLVADKVLAYDDNRDLIRDADGQPMTVTRGNRAIGTACLTLVRSSRTRV
ncbi:hypothetical protein [Antarctobacter heliothermus]|uniref:Uncharacterized protein n=1 Tax=Antarctobacter heliothermus TaxID=74033 RepID=A0A239ILJ5_9RHOB|nr:hypothetical protein [Antarctobacter heliothermus]SNS94419.1 hypothetical protein SAMN04488078_10442 [Antarctobacter heliothermus]